MKTQLDSYIETYSGKKFHILDPQPDEIDIIDIAHALSMNCRYTGHCLEFYSIAEHSVYTSQLVSEENKLWALLHDCYSDDTEILTDSGWKFFKDLDKDCDKVAQYEENGNISFVHPLRYIDKEYIGDI